jgi:hypothetical protein
MINYWGRIHRFSIQFTPQPNATAANPSSSNLQFTYMNSILLSGPNGDVLTMPLTGLDADPKRHLFCEGLPEPACGDIPRR